MLERLDAKQLEAATNRGQYVLCNSKAGSGKTKTLMNRCLYLMENGVKPQEIMLVTFTNKAAAEMMTRIKKLSPDGNKILCGTFHNIALIYLRKYADLIGFDSSFTILTPDDGEKIMKELVKAACELHSLPDEWKKALKPSKLIHEYSSARNLDYDIETYFTERQYVLGLIPIIKEIITDYENRKQYNDLMDFDDLLHYFNLLLQMDEVKEFMHSTFKHILVDEFQDVNNVQFAIVNSLVGDKGHLFAVGDPFQCIYGFRGSQIEYIDSFEDYYGANVVELNKNYRSTQEILDLGAEVTGDRARMVAHLGHGKKPNLYISEGRFGMVANEKMARHIVGQINQLIKVDKVDPTEIAVLCRSTNQIQLIEAELKKNNIAYAMRAGFSYFEKSHIKDTLSFLSITINKKNKEGLSRVLKLFKGLGPKAIKEFVAAYDKNGCNLDLMAQMVEDKSYKLSKNAKEGFEEFYKLYTRVKNEPSIENKIKIFFDEFYAAYIVKEYPDDSDVRLSEVAGLKVMSNKYKKLEEFINDVMVDTSRNNKESGDDKTAKVVVSTIHRAKGLEWDHVFICNMESMYKAPSTGEENGDTFCVSEDARLLYVAITRARKNLSIYAASNDIYGYGKTSVNLSHLLRNVHRVNKYRL